ncbi:protein MraZ [Enterococcus faecium]|nr:protein MraZ [Enterococcus faecium]
MKIRFIVILIVGLFLSELMYLISSYMKFEIEKMEKRKKEDEHLLHIDTSDAAKVFANLLNNNLTFFLHGEWGTGKTEFLKEVEKNTKKKFVYINLWNIKDERSVINIGFSILHPVINFIYRTFLIGCVVVSILITPAVNIGLGKVISYLFGESILINYIIPVATVFSLFIAIWQFFKYKSDDGYYKLFQSRFTEYFLRKKILIIDDFDRLSESNQEGAYKLFNCINGKIPIVFVGDESKLQNDKKDKYLQKIINQKVELPYSLHPKNIWRDYFELLEKKFSCNVSQAIIDVFTEENRNLRERKMYHHYVIQELEIRDKKDYVQINQQLAIIYLYLFYPSKYRNLVDNQDISETIQEDKLIELSLILKNTEGYPKPFTVNRLGYFLYEKVLTLTEEQALKLLQKSNLDSVMIEKGSYNDDFYEYVVRNFSKFDTAKKNDLVRAALINISRSQDSTLVSDIIEFKNNEVRKSLNSNNIQLKVDSWKDILDEHSFDISQQLYFFEKYIRISFFDLSKIYINLDLESEDFFSGKRKDYYFLTCLSINKMWQRFDWPEIYWESLNMIFSENEQNYLFVLDLLRLIEFDQNNETIIAYKDVYNELKEVSLEGASEAFEKIRYDLNLICDKLNMKIEIRDKNIVQYT